MIGLLMFLFHVLGLISSIHSVMSTRTSQGTIAWVIALNTFPYLAVPGYWILGRSRFQGYVKARQVTSGGQGQRGSARIFPLR
jgi:cardiolipin synthase